MFADPSPVDSKPFAAWIEDNADKLISRLREAVEIPSVSGEASYRCVSPHPSARRLDRFLIELINGILVTSPHVHKMGEWLQGELVKLGAECVRVFPLLVVAQAS